MWACHRVLMRILRRLHNGIAARLITARLTFAITMGPCLALCATSAFGTTTLLALALRTFAARAVMLTLGTGRDVYNRLSRCLRFRRGLRTQTRHIRRRHRWIGTATAGTRTPPKPGTFAYHSFRTQRDRSVDRLARIRRRGARAATRAASTIATTTATAATFGAGLARLGR